MNTQPVPKPTTKRSRNAREHARQPRLGPVAQQEPDAEDDPPGDGVAQDVARPSAPRRARATRSAGVRKRSKSPFCRSVQSPTPE